MNIVKTSLSAVPALALTASLAWIEPTSAQNTAAQPDPGGGVTMAQFVARQTARIMAADTDGDGRISRAEMEATASNGKHDPSRRFDAMDTNHDGYLDKGEIQAALERRFHKLDVNGDGILTPDERMAIRREHQSEPAGMSAASQP